MFDDPATNFNNSNEEMKQSEREQMLGNRKENAAKDLAAAGSMSDSLYQLKDSISEDTRNLFKGVASGVKNIKEKVVGPSAKKAKLVEGDDEDEDPCHYESLDAENPDKSAG